MPLTDRHGNPVSTGSRDAVDQLDAAIEMLLGYRADPLAAVDAILAEQPDFAIAHAFRAALLVLSFEQGCVPAAEASIAAAWGVRGINARETAHLAAARAWCDGDFAEAKRRYEGLAAA